MLEFGVDEITLVLQLSLGLKKKYKPFDWEIVADDLINTFVQKSNFETIFGEAIQEKRAPQGYTVAYTFGRHDFYLVIAYHPFHSNMGIVVKFSARALDYYCENSGMKVYEFLQCVKDDTYSVRLSRIDLVADYIDEGVNVTTIAENFKKNKIGIFREKVNENTGEITYRRSNIKFEGYLKGEEVPTIYLGSVQSNSQMRVYDKKREQLERNGTKLKKAKSSLDWVRFEGVFKGEFAHQLSEELLRIQNDSEYANLIASTLIQKYRFMYIDNGVIDCETEYTDLLLKCITNQNFTLKSPSSRNYDIFKSMNYIFNGSGFISTLYKIKAIWGDDAISFMLKFIEEYLDGYEPNDDCRYWLNNNLKSYEMSYSDFDDFFNDFLELMHEERVSSNNEA